MNRITQSEYEMLVEALTDLSNKFNSTLINRQVGRLEAKLEKLIEGVY
tara:strand:+ start:86 stop:229 length:144 start_codon:yes stop_codon:yes gene_type:complete